MTSQPGKHLQYTYCPIFRKVKAMKFGQLIEYNLRNIFLKKHTQNEVEKLFPVLFLRKSKLSIYLDQ